MKKAALTILLLLPSLNTSALTLTSQDIAQRTRALSLKAKSISLENELARADVAIAKSQYDPTATAAVSYTKDDTERSSVIFGTSTSQGKFDAGLTQLTPLGTQMQLGFTNTRDSSNSAFFNPNTYFDSRLTGSISQPLLKNGLGYGTRKNVTAAKTASTAVRHGTSAKLNELIYKNLALYWSWYLNRHLINIHEQAVLLARRLYNTNVQKLEMGLIEKPDLHAFAANLNLKKSNLIILQSEVSKTENLLRAALDLTEEKTIVPGQEIFRQAQTKALDQLIVEALNQHPALRAARQDLKAHNIRMAMQKNARLPQLDLVASLASNGIDPEYPPAAADITDLNPVWSAGVNFSMPVGNRGARNQFKKLDVIKQQKLFQLKDLENQVISQLRLSCDHYRNTLNNLEVTADAVFNQRLKWDGEVLKYNQGRSDPDLVIRYQDDYLNAKAGHLRAKVETGLAWLELQFAQGVTPQ